MTGEIAPCAYFALCDRPADGVVELHPILGNVPCCRRCAQVAGVELTIAEVVVA